MRRVIAISRPDPVSMGVARTLIDSFGFKEVGESTYRREDVDMVFMDEKHIFAEMAGERLGASLLVFPSSHRSEKGVRAFLAHPVGNWGEEAQYGGRPRALSMTSARMLERALKTLVESVERHALYGWDVRLEVTHHGPYTNVPTIFVEVGGGGPEVGEGELEAVAEASLAAARAEPAGDRCAIGFGGGHYAPIFTKLVSEGSYIVGHMCPKYAMPLDEELVRQAVEKTVEKPRIALVEWKGMSSDNRKKLIEILERLGLEIVRI